MYSNQSLDQIKPVFVIKIPTVELSDEFFKFLLDTLQVYCCIALDTVRRKIVTEKNAWIIETCHFNVFKQLNYIKHNNY